MGLKCCGKPIVLGTILCSPDIWSTLRLGCHSSSTPAVLGLHVGIPLFFPASDGFHDRGSSIEGGPKRVVQGSPTAATLPGDVPQNP